MQRALLTGLLFAVTLLVHVCRHRFTLTSHELLHILDLRLSSAWTEPSIHESMQKNGNETIQSFHPVDSLDSENPLGVCNDPHVRKEWRTLSISEQKGWIQAVKCMVKTLGSGNMLIEPVILNNVSMPYNASGSIYDDFTFVHIALNNDIHQTGLFLPWHRYFLWSFEQALRVHCNYSGVMPYWDWSQDAEDFEHATIFSSDPNAGLGGFGHPAHDNAVVDGAFAWFPLSYPVLHTLRREYTPYPFRNLTRRLYPKPDLTASNALKRDEVHKMTNGFLGDYKGFQFYLEGMQGAHMCVHLLLGGDLGGTCLSNAPASCGPDASWSPNEPLFWLHHGMVDKVWYDWQRVNGDNFWAFEAGTLRDLDTWPQYPNGAPPTMTLSFELPTSGLLVGNYTIQDMFNTTSNSPLCYIYD